MECDFTSTRVTKTASAQGEMVFAGSLLYYALVDDGAIRVQEVERDGSSTHVTVMRSVDLNQRRSVAMAHGQQTIKQPACQAHDTFVYRFYTNVIEVFEANFYRGKAEIV